jgi:hypothetical protein
LEYRLIASWYADYGELAMCERLKMLGELQF